MIPDHIDFPGSPWPVLPPGIHVATLAEVELRFASNPKRRVQFKGLVAALTGLRGAGCRRAFLDGSFVTAKPHPGDFDACWDPTGVDGALLDPVLLTFDNNRAAQKVKYQGELFPSAIPADRAGTIFIEFFQVDRFTGARKGIVAIDLSADPMLQPTVTS
ncbi:DUF6932 family protein [Frigidibacter mobilis]|uniref:Uncharacterized protein n=1 Tax=Frigidibacter mobilis TaxID=1335048 RepID=A0A159Z7V1_9RHOB|nr:hypothetical protein [Frigidibacter mobilis]AMY70698.1 hypothetical protein AKL17_3474 [Frigidibacter mobilis]